MRIDSGFREGDEVTFFYDPLDATIQGMLDGLRQIVIDGPATNLAFLIATLSHAVSKRGQVFTGFVDKFKITLIPPQPLQAK